MSLYKVLQILHQQKHEFPKMLEKDLYLQKEV